MKHAILVLGILFGSVLVSAQQTDSTARDHFPHNFISLNPINISFIQQLGLTYEYRYKRIGFGLSGGYIYPSKFNIGRLFMARTVNFGPFEFYKGFFCNPQINIYLKNPERLKRNAIVYIAVKGIYKYMHVDSTKYYEWDYSRGDYYDIDMKLVDRCHIGGVFVDFGVKYENNGFFIDFNIGPGVLIQQHNAYFAGREDGGGHSNYPLPLAKDSWTKVYPSINFSLNLGGAF
jgi:hypothetical protein